MGMGMLGRSRDNERGAALVEAAIVLPILLLLTFGIWTTARAWNVGNTMAHAAREAARYGATVDPWDASPVADIADDDLASSSINPSLLEEHCIELVRDGDSPSCDDHVNDTGTDQVYVKLEYLDYDLNFLFFSVDIDLEANAISRFEASP